MMMSFLGSSGCLMSGSGLSEALETVYGPNSVLHMLSGKAVARALRGHFLTEAALTSKVISNDFLLDPRVSDASSEDIDYDGAEVDDSDTELHQHTSSAADSEHSSAISDSTIDELKTLVRMVSANVEVSDLTIFQSKQTTFLSNENNKSKFIDMLKAHLRQHGHDVYQSDSDADCFVPWLSAPAERL